MPKARIVRLCISLALLSPAVVMAQQAPTGTQIPAPAPGDRPLSGIREIGLGATRPRHSFIQPSASVFGGWDSNGNFENRPEYAVSLLGQLTMVHFIGRRGSLEYDGSVRFDNRRMEYQDRLTTSQQLRWSQQFTGRSWSFLLSDEVLFTPSSMGGPGGLIAGISPEDLGIPVLDPSVVPDQTILTDSSRRLTNTAALEVEYRVSHRTSMTLSGSQGIFRSIDNNLLDGTQYNGNAGYNFAFNPRDTFALVAGYELNQIDRAGVTIRSYSPGFRYVHGAGGRLLFQMSGYAQPYELSAAGFNRNTFSWGGNAGLQFRVSRSMLQFDVNRAMSLGSGLLAGSRVVSASANLTRPLLRSWQFNVNGMYARNSGLRGEATYNTAYGGAGLERQVTRSGSMFLRYVFQRGLSNCTVTGCGPEMLQHVVSVGFNWTRSPIGIF